MENVPNQPDTSSEVADKKDSKKKKKAEKIGSFLVLPETKPKDDKKEKKSLIDELLGDDKKPEKTDNKPEQKESEDKIDELTSEEKQFIEREYVQAYERGEDIAPETPEEIAAEAAVEEFHELIKDGVDSEDALNALMEKLNHAEAQKAAKDEEEDQQNILRRNLGRLSEFIMPDHEEENHESENEDIVPVQPINLSFISHPQEPAKNIFSHEGPKEKEAKEKPKKVANPAGAALLGGVVGYLVGRRRNKINSEKKLLTVQKKLQKEVVDLGWQLSEKEETIRRVAKRNSYIAIQHEAVKPKAERVKPIPEILGRVIVSSESEEVIFSREKPTSKAKFEAPKAETLKVTKNVENLKRGELLEISRKIIVGGTSLRQIYESHLIGERGLRRLVKEHLRGGNVKKALKRELIQREIDFERDPLMRDQDITRVEHAQPANIETLIARASENISYENGSSLSFDKKPDVKIEVQAPAQKVRALDVLLTSVIAILSGVIVILIIHKY